MGIKLKVCLFALSFILLSACNSRFEPAPVETLSTKLASKQNLTEITSDEYKVEPGDTLFAIAFYSGNDYREIAKLNNINAPYNINVGQTILLTKKDANNNSSQNIDLGQVEQKIDNTTIDPTNKQAYGEHKSKIHRKNQTNESKSSIKPYKRLSWDWPAKGRGTIATVGSDGTTRGLDIKGTLGTSIKAAADGKVVYAGNALKGYGNLIIVKHDNNYLSAYAHNQTLLVGEQTYVKQGQRIATMGSTGASEIMLHFEIRKKGKSVDPFIYLPER